MNGKVNNPRVLFLTRQYAPVPKVCEVCVKRVREALYTKGIASDVLQFTGDPGIVECKEYGYVYSAGAGEGVVNTTVKSPLVLFCRRARVAYRWPFYYNSRLNRIFSDKLRELDSIYHYDAIVGVTLPVDTAYAGINNDRFILYELDAITNNPQIIGKIKSLYRKRVEKIEKVVFDNASLIIHMECNREYFRKTIYEQYRGKSVFADIPNLIRIPDKNDAGIGDHYLLAYFGTLTRDIRNPEYLIKLIEASSEVIKERCEFYSRGNCEDILEEAAIRKPGIINPKGYVTPDEVLAAQINADFLLSIGNKLSGEDRSLPSKILEYIATGKPIIHIHGGNNDSAVKYLEEYGLACIIDPTLDFDVNVRKYIDFVCSCAGKRVPFEIVRNKFPQNLPDHTAGIIEDYIQHRL